MNKNTCLSVLLYTLCLSLVGCSGKEPQCKHNASVEDEISWTDYNTIGAMWNYFGCYDKTAREHYGDTVKVVGYIVPGSQGITGPFDYDSTRILHYGLDLGDQYDIANNKQKVFALSFYQSETLIPMLTDYQYGQLVYATVIIKGRTRDGFCCSGLALRPIELKIMEKENINEDY